MYGDFGSRLGGGICLGLLEDRRVALGYVLDFLGFLVAVTGDNSC